MERLYHFRNLLIQFSTTRFGDFRNAVIRAFKFILSIQFNTTNYMLNLLHANLNELLWNPNAMHVRIWKLEIDALTCDREFECS